MINSIDVDRIHEITTQIQSINDFIENIKKNVTPIKALYIVTDSQYRIEIKENFSDETTQSIFDIIIETRLRLLEQLETKLSQVVSLTKLP